MTKIVPVIMSGGAGSRLWPVSTEQTPKQFHAFSGGRTMLQETVLRVAHAPGLDLMAPIIVCNRRHLSIVSEQFAALGMSPGAIVLEPFGRSTAAVAVIAARIAAERHPGARVLLLPADHIIADEAGFRAAIGRAAAVEDRIVTFGIQPTAPETGYGYIQRAEALAQGIFEIARFAEKPELSVAQAYLADGSYLWNGGIFLFRPEVLLSEISLHRPDILASASAALSAADTRDGVIRLADDLFAAVPSVSLDSAVMESTNLGAVVPCDVGWADVGSWSELWRLGQRDRDGNLSRGDVTVLDTSASLVWAEGGSRIAVVGMSDVIVVAAGGAIIVLPRSRAQEVKRIVETLAARAEPRGDGS